jgi:hypothetical protein
MPHRHQTQRWKPWVRSGRVHLAQCKWRGAGGADGLCTAIGVRRQVAQAHGGYDGFGAAASAEPLVGVRQVKFDCSPGATERSGDRIVGVTLADQLNHFALFGAQPSFRRDGFPLRRPSVDASVRAPKVGRDWHARRPHNYTARDDSSISGSLGLSLAGCIALGRFHSCGNQQVAVRLRGS